jgi:non-canonical (house-cleaning) NTP pyrophosphatase
LPARGGDPENGVDQEYDVQPQRDHDILVGVAHGASRHGDHVGDVMDATVKHGAIRRLQRAIGGAAHGDVRRSSAVSMIG